MRSLSAGLLTGLLLAACSSSPELNASVETGAEGTTTTEVEATTWTDTAADDTAADSTGTDVTATNEATSNDGPAGDTYTLVTMSLVDGSAIPTPDEMQAISTEHSAFVDWLHLNGGLIGAGPVVPPRGDSLVRQIMFFDTDQAEEALERCCEGPANGTGLYETAASRFVTTCDMTRIGASAMNGGSALRPYVMVTGPASAAMTTTFHQMGAMVLCQGTCIDGPFEDRCLAILDCTDVEAAHMFMSEVCADTSDLGYHAWIGPVAFTVNR